MAIPAATKTFLALILSLFSLTFAGQGFAVPFILTNGPGDGTLQVGVDGFGSFGSSIGSNASNAVYDPVGLQGPAGTSFESGIFLSGPPGFLSSGNIGGSGNLANPTITGDNTNATSSFSRNFLDFNLNQRLIDSFDSGGNRVGTILEQRYQITNTATVPNNFGITRYLDGDLFFDGTIQDGGGRLEVAGNEILYETDAASGPGASTTFVGITGTGGTIPSTGRFEIDSFSGLRSRIISGAPLDDIITGDNNGDGFIDTPYDVTLALNNQFMMAPAQTVTYTTLTLFGNAVPPAPGSSEALPLLPADDEPPFVFEVEVEPGITTWFDPVVATGYDYEILSGPNFAGVTMPSFSTVPQPTPYEVFVGGILETILNPGETYSFGTVGVDMFQILGIDPGLGLDPNDPLAFPTGLNFVSAGTVQFTMTPLTTDTGAVPEPLPFALFGIGLVALGFGSRRNFRRS